jgi:hypothetical protein
MLQFSAQSDLSRVWVQVHLMLDQVQLGNCFGRTFCTIAFLVLSRGYMQNFRIVGVSKCDLFIVAAPATVSCCSSRAEPLPRFERIQYVVILCLFYGQNPAPYGRAQNGQVHLAAPQLPSPCWAATVSDRKQLTAASALS